MPIDTVTISKRLSLWLRHKPQDGDLALDSQGWTDVEPVLRALNKAKLPGDWDTLLEVVETNDKQRFELSADGGRIRARQGHSIAIDLALQAREPPEALFHGTIERFLAAILAQGLKPMKRHHVHLSPDIETATRVGARRGKPVILAVAALEMTRSGSDFFLTENGVWLTAHVAPLYLKRLD